MVVVPAMLAPKCRLQNLMIPDAVLEREDSTFV
jgi:hypothetical protein